MLRKIFMPAVLLLLNSCDPKTNVEPTEPHITITDVTLPEGNGGFKAFEFTISLDHAYSKDVTVTVNTKEGTAKAGEDFTAISNQTISFAANETSKKIT